MGTLNELRRLGVGVVRVYVPWASLAPNPQGRSEPSGFDADSPAAYPPAGWAPYDAIVRAAQPRGIAVYFTLEGPAPLWAAGSGAPKGAPGGGGYWKPSASAYGAFVHAVATRYDGSYTPPGSVSPLPRVSMWSIWNEPNFGPQLAPQAIDDSTIETSPAMYRALLNAGWSALNQTGHRGDTILIGELAPYGLNVGNNPGNFGYMVPLRFIRALYCVDSSLRPLTGTAAAERGCPTTEAASTSFAADNPALFQATGYAVHPYLEMSTPPNAVIADQPDFANLAALPMLERLLETVTGEYGQRRQFPLYNTEFGYITDPPLAGWAPVALAAVYENWAEYISWRNPLIRSWDHYLLVDPPPSGPSHFFSGLEFSDGAPKATYAAYRMPIYLPVTTTSSGHPLEVWGCVRPAHDAQLATHLAQRVQIELQPSGSASFKAIRSVSITSPDGYFDVDVPFPSSGSVRLAWSYPQGPTIYSRLVGVTIH